jgi:hypothetical protein
MGWVFISLGILLIGMGSFLGYYGQQLLTEKPPTQIERLLTAPQERLLALLFQRQREFASSKIVINRNGQIHFDDPELAKTNKVNFLADLYRSKEGDYAKASEFTALVESLPTDYVRFHAEARWDNPFVLSVTEAGVKYLRDHK